MRTARGQADVVAAIGFGELVGLMVWGTDAPDTCLGLLREVDDDGERRRRVARDGYRTRVETEHGEVRHITGDDADWYWDLDAGVMRVRPHDSGLDVAFGGAPIEQTAFLGRSCWTVELAPPQHKPFPLRITVDAETGLVLREENAGFRTATEWVDVEIGVTLADDTFRWTGPAEPLPTRADRRREHENDMAQRQAWLADRGLTTIALPSSVEISLHHWDDATGAFYAGVDAAVHATLLRRPVSDDHWAEPGTTHYDHSYRWADPRWDWFLATDDPLAPDELARVQTQLRSTT